jgi:hypothetical protein
MWSIAEFSGERAFASYGFKATQLVNVILQGEFVAPIAETDKIMARGDHQ